MSTGIILSGMKTNLNKLLFILERRTADRDDIVMDINYNLEILLLLRCDARLLIIVMFIVHKIVL